MAGAVLPADPVMDLACQDSTTFNKGFTLRWEAL